MKRLVVLSLVATVAACGPASEPSSEPTELQHGDPIPGRYIVTLDASALPSSFGAVDRAVVANIADELRAVAPFETEAVFSRALLGFSVSATQDDVEILGADARVASIEPDIFVQLGVEASGKPAPAPPMQSTPWGITRVGGSKDGSGRRAWVIDSGIDLDHPDLVVDTARSRSFLFNTTNPDDQNGHGTHVAGTIAAKNDSVGVVGVAAGATVVAVRVLDRQGSGSYSGVIAGVDYVAANGAPGDVANMSLGGPISPALDTAVTNAAATGVLFSIAAGNSTADASNYSPARVNAPNVFTISAVDSTDKMASFSNFGAGVDFAEPGVSVKSTYKGGSYATLSGTSMAAPHAAGLLLLGPIGTDGRKASADPDSIPDPIGVWPTPTPTPEPTPAP